MPRKKSVKRRDTKNKRSENRRLKNRRLKNRRQRNRRTKNMNKRKFSRKFNKKSRKNRNRISRRQLGGNTTETKQRFLDLLVQKIKQDAEDENIFEDDDIADMRSNIIEAREKAIEQYIYGLLGKFYGLTRKLTNDEINSISTLNEMNTFFHTNGLIAL